VLGCHTLIRVETSGSLRGDVKVGDIVITMASVRLDGTSRTYVNPSYPAVASYEVVLALIEVAGTLNVKFYVGITASSDSFYVGQGRPGYKGYLPRRFKHIIEDLSSVNVLNF